MEIQATLKFKHGRMVRFLKDNNMTIKKLAELSGVGAVTLGSFIRFKGYLNVDKEKFMALLQTFDPDITHEEVFPDQFRAIAEVLKPRVSVNDIPTEMLLSYENTLRFAGYLENHDDDFDREKVVKRALEKLRSSKLYDGKRRAKILESYYGLTGENPKSCEEIARDMDRTTSCVSSLKKEAIKSICMDKSVRKIFKEIDEGRNPIPEYREHNIAWVDGKKKVIGNPVPLDPEKELLIKAFQNP